MYEMTSSTEFDPVDPDHGFPVYYVTLDGFTVYATQNADRALDTLNSLNREAAVA